MLATFTALALARQDGRPEMLTGLPLEPEHGAHRRRVAAANQAAGWKVEYRNFCVRKVETVHVDNRHDRALDTFTARISQHAQAVITKLDRENVDEDTSTQMLEWYYSRTRAT